jgi:hypothetical protein
MLKQILKKKGFEFTTVHEMERAENEGFEVFKVREEKGCLPVPTVVQCPYSKINYYKNCEEELEEMLSKCMEE